MASNSEEAQRLFAKLKPLKSDEESAQVESAPPAVEFDFGTVYSCEDPNSGGALVVVAPMFGDKPTKCDYVSPVAGANYGFFALPGIGATVLVGRITSKETPTRSFWMGCLYSTNTAASPSMRLQPYTKNDQNQLPRTEVDDSGTPEQVTDTLSHGVPNQGSVYADNGLPDSWVFKHPCGHFIEMTQKRGSQRIVDEIKIKTAGGKKIIFDDAGDTITIIDENDNSIQITSEGDNKDSIVSTCGGNYEVYSKTGKMEGIIGPDSAGDYTVDVVGKGSILLTAHEGVIKLASPKGITLQCGDSTIKLNPNGITIKGNLVSIEANTLVTEAGTMVANSSFTKMSGTTINIEAEAGVSVTGATGDIMIGKVGFVKHQHFERQPNQPTTSNAVPSQ